jgi:hypothetical protein
MDPRHQTLDVDGLPDFRVSFGLDPTVLIDRASTGHQHHPIPRLYTNENHKGKLPSTTDSRLIGISDGVTHDLFFSPMILHFALHYEHRR